MIRFKVRDETVRLTVKSHAFGFNLKKAVVVRTGHKTYEGPYEVTPKADEQQTLQTKGMSMKEDMTVKAIPYFDVSNNAGGQTIYIGTEV